MISLLVEGKGDREAGPQLIRRLLHEHLQEYEIQVESRATATSGKGDLKRWYEDHLRLLSGNQRCQGIVVIVDSDHELPCELARELATRAQGVASVPVVVTCPVEEFENWFVCIIESICQDRVGIADCEHVYDAKKILDECLPNGYTSTLDQAGLVWKIDLDLAMGRSRSFNRLIHAVEELVQAVHSGSIIFTPSTN
jgi:hypothetical protein